MNQRIGQSVTELMTAEYAPIKEIWGKVITDQSLTMIYAPPKAGKTFFAWKLAHSIATGTKFLKWVCTQSKVAIIDGEMSARDLAQRAIVLDESAPSRIRGGQMLIITPDDTGGSMWNMANHHDQLKFDEATRGYQVVIFDNYLNCSFPENPRDDEIARWARIQPWLIRLRSAGKAVILIHHANKEGKAEGTQRKENTMNNVIAIRPIGRSSDSTRMELVFERMRNLWGDDLSPIVIELINSSDGKMHWAWNEAEDDRIVKVRKMLAQRLPVAEIAKALNIDVWDAIELVDKAKGGM